MKGKIKKVLSVCCIAAAFTAERDVFVTKTLFYSWESAHLTMWQMAFFVLLRKVLSYRFV